MSVPVPIMMLVLNLDVGGQERMLIELTRKLDRQRFSPVVCCLAEEGELAPELRGEGIEVLALRKSAGIPRHTVLTLRRLLRDRRIRLVHSHNNPGLIFGALATAGSITRHVHTKHGVGVLSRFTRWKNGLAGLTVNRLVPVSEALYRQCHEREGIPKRKLVRIENGVDLAPYLAIERPRLEGQGPIIGHVARLSAVKNQALLLRLLARLHDTHPAARLVIIGDGPERSKLEQMAQELALTASVSFLGMRRDIPAQLATVDWFALSSRSEGTPISVIEAMASGLPVTSTAVGGMSRIITHDKTGLLAPLDDEAAHLANWQRLADNGALRGRFGMAARDYARQHYDIDSMVNAYQMLYEQALL